MSATLAEQLERAASTTPDLSDATGQRVLDAAVQEAAAVGLRRLTVEDVVRRSQVARMTVYRRYPRRDDLVEALVARETQRFLAAVSSAIEAADDPEHGLVEAFVAAVGFARTHPMLRRTAEIDPGGILTTIAAGDAALLRIGRDFIAERLHTGRGPVPERVTWVADAFARLFVTYVAVPPELAGDQDLRRFARAVLLPLAVSAGRSRAGSPARRS